MILLPGKGGLCYDLPDLRREMEEGGLIASGLNVMWFPLEQFDKKGLERLWYEGGKSVGKSNYLLAIPGFPA